MNREEVAGKQATTVAGATPMASAVGNSALVEAACEYSREEAMTTRMANSHGLPDSAWPRWAWIQSLLAVMKVVPSQATPRMQAQAFMPVLKIEAAGMALGLARHRTRIAPAAASMTEMRHCPASMTGSAMTPTFSEVRTE